MLSFLAREMRRIATVPFGWVVTHTPVAFRGNVGSARRFSLRFQGRSRDSVALVLASLWHRTEQVLGCQAGRSATGERPATRDPSYGMDRQLGDRLRCVPLYGVFGRQRDFGSTRV
jgi:hypothetical protein